MLENYGQRSRNSFSKYGESIIQDNSNVDQQIDEPVEFDSTAFLKGKGPSLIDQIRVEDVLGTGHKSDAQIRQIHNQEHKERPLLSLPGMPDNKPVMKPALRQDVQKAWKEEEEFEGLDRTMAYVKNLISHMDVMERNRGELPKKEENIDGGDDFKKYAQMQRQIDEQRRKEIETELRAIWGGKFTKSGYSENEGFLFSADFVMTRNTRFEHLYLRYSVWVVGQKISETFKTEGQIGEDFAEHVQRVFIGQSKIVENIKPDQETFLIIEVVNTFDQGNTKSQELVGWTLLQLFDDMQNLMEQKWVCPIYKPPTQFAALPSQMTNRLEIIKSSKLFVRISLPRNKDLNYKLRKNDPLDDSYLASPFHNQVFRPPKFYAEWKDRLAKNKLKALELANDIEVDIDMIKRYLDDEDQFIKDDMNREEKITKGLADDLDNKLKKKFQDEEDPLKKNNDDLSDVIKNIKDLKAKGKEGEDIVNILDDEPGPKTGIKVYFNNIFNVVTENPLKIEFTVYMGKDKIFDEFGNPADYILPLIDSHVDYEALILQKNKKSKKSKKRIDVEVDEVWYVVKDFDGVLKLLKYNSDIWFLFKLFEITGESKIRDIQGIKGTDFRVKEQRVAIGWQLFKVTMEDDFDKEFMRKNNGQKKLVIREGRYKEQIMRGSGRPPPPDPTKMPPKRTKSWMDFTIETFVYETMENSKYAYRRKKKKAVKVKEDDGYDRRAFIPNPERQWLDVPFEKGQ